jgi:N-acetylglucosamine-6-sulfatase
MPPAINLGFGADRVQQVLWRIDLGELNGLMPQRVSHPDRLKTLRINDGLVALTKEARNDCLDLGPQFLDAQGNIPAALMSDAVHPKLSGYQIWGDALAPSLP